MPVKIKKITTDEMDIYAGIPISFKVKSILEPRLIDGGLGGIELFETRIKNEYTKDYDAKGSGPAGWHKKFDTKNWGYFTAVDENKKIIGGMVIAFNTDNVNMLEGRDDISVLWDLRVHPDYRRKGVGKALFKTAVEWSEERNCRQMKIETQNINVNACRFYAAQGCSLGGINKHIYKEKDCENEIRLLWYYEIH